MRKVSWNRSPIAVYWFGYRDPGVDDINKTLTFKDRDKGIVEGKRKIFENEGCTVGTIQVSYDMEISR